MGIMQALMGSYSSAVAAATDSYYHFVSLLVRGDTVADLSDNSLTVTASNGASVDTGTTKFSSGSLSFDGVDDIVGVANDDALDLSTGDWTIECWAYHDGQMPANVGLFGKRDTGSDYAPFSVIGENNTDATKALRFFGSATGSGWDVAITGTTDFPLDQWVHVAVTKSGNVYTLWQNGLSIGTATVSGDLMTNTDQVTIGQSSTGSFGSNNHWKGNVENFRITKGIARYTGDFSSDLPSASFPTAAPSGADPYWPEVILLMDGTSLTDDLSNAENDVSNYTNSESSGVNPGSTSLPVTLGTTDGTTVDHPYGNTGVPYLDFHEDDGLAIPTTFDLSGGDWTFECWAYFDSISQFQSIFSSAQSGIQLSLKSDPSPTQLEFSLSGGNSLTHPTTISAATWYHVALTFIASTQTLALYIDGTSTSSSRSDWTTSTNQYFGGSNHSVPNHVVVFGVNRSNGFPLDGKLTDVRFTKGVARDIATDWTNGVYNSAMPKS